MALRELIPCARSASANCAPTDMTGLSAFIADCITTDRLCQRIAARRRPVIATRFSPWNVTEPAVTAAGGDSSWATANSSVDLPQPDSPTMPTNSPVATSNDTSSTARTGLPPVAYSTVRPDTSSMGRPPEKPPGAAGADRAQRRVADLVERVVEQRERRAQERNGRTRHDRLQVVAGLQRLVVLRPVEHRAPRDRARVAEPDELQAGGEQHVVQRVGEEC